jgi:hypothetical protein
VRAVPCERTRPVPDPGREAKARAEAERARVEDRDPIGLGIHERVQQAAVAREREPRAADEGVVARRHNARRATTRPVGASSTSRRLSGSIT